MPPATNYHLSDPLGPLCICSSARRAAVGDFNSWPECGHSSWFTFCGRNPEGNRYLCSRVCCLLRCLSGWERNRCGSYQGHWYRREPEMAYVVLYHIGNSWSSAQVQGSS